ncbi:glutamate-rich protein 6B isoform X2 [Mastomys coucha]|uniref:glutamate-rich protein 6B isoform X2 n=1 Tax=Mastomys coucha TaxID=35658 RepID=UPI0012614580|nr:glutamate-rich protein 6B isoform X2 [Mastomys coucha]
MSDDTLSSRSSPPGSPKASKYSRRAPSPSEDSQSEDDESSQDESLSDAEDESTECTDELDTLDFGDDESEEEYLEEDEVLDEEAVLQRETYLLQAAHMEETAYLKEKRLRRHLEDEFKIDTTSSLLDVNARSPVPSISQGTHLSSSSSGSTHDLKTPTSSYYSLPGISVTLRDQSSQTEWAYKSKSGLSLKSKTRLDQDSSMLIYSKSDLEESDSFHPEAFWDTLMNEPFSKQEERSFESLPSTYQSVFREILQELAIQDELEDDMEISLSKLMEDENRKKLGALLKKNFEKYKEPIMWILKQCEAMEIIPEQTITITYLISTLQQPEKPEEKVFVSHPSLSRLHLDHRWAQARMKVHQSDGKLAAYHSGKSFHVFFPNGTGQIYYPSGNLALLISCEGVEKLTYIVLEDSVRKNIRGLVTNSGHATFYNEDGGIWLSLSKLLGYYFPKGKRQKAWNWWDLSLHVHAPPFMCITLKLNKYIRVQIRSQDKVIFCFLAPKQRQICLNMGTKFKLINPNVHQALMQKVVLETDPRPTSWKIHFLLEKITRSLSFLTLSDLEDFIAVAQDSHLSQFILAPSGRLSQPLSCC